MNIICRIDKEMYKCVSESILTDEVILTENRIEHIIERRGQDFYDEYSKYFSDILLNPDYIFKESDNTALVSKTFSCNDVNVNLVLRLVVYGDNPDFRNSVISAVRENNRRFAQRLRNNEPVYKKSIDKQE